MLAAPSFYIVDEEKKNRVAFVHVLYIKNTFSMNNFFNCELFAFARVYFERLCSVVLALFSSTLSNVCTHCSDVFVQLLFYFHCCYFWIKERKIWCLHWMVFVCHSWGVWARSVATGNIDACHWFSIEFIHSKLSVWLIMYNTYLEACDTPYSVNAQLSRTSRIVEGSGKQLCRQGHVK